MALNDKEKKIALKLYTEGRKWREIYQALPHKDPEEIRGFIRNTKIYKQRHQHQDVNIDIPVSISLGEFLNELSQFQNKVKNFDTHFDTYTVNIDTPYIGIIDWGDWHIGAREVNYKKLQQDIDVIKNTPNFYAVGNGDWLDNSIEGTHPGTRFEQIITPKVAKELIKKIVEELSGKWLAIVSGDHDNWSFITDDFAPAEYFAKHGKAPYFHWGGILDLNLKNINYKIGIRHRYYGMSRKNIASPHENLWRDFGVDIVMLAHTHQNMAQQQVIDGDRLKIFLNSGSYKIWDNYHHRGGYPNSQAVFPAVVLSGYEKKGWVFADFYDAIEFLNGVLE